MIRLVPNTVVDQRLNSATPEERLELEREFGLDRPVYDQYFRWLAQIARGDLGRSWLNDQSIGGAIQTRMPVTLEVLSFSMLISIPLGIASGAVSAVRRNKPDDYAVRLVTILFLAVPSFWLATLLIVLPLFWWQYSPPVPFSRIEDDLWRNLRLVIPAAATIAIGNAALLARVTRSELLNVLQQDYIRTARAKGLSGRVVIARHAIRNALPPLVTIIGLAFANGIAGTVVAEQIFGIPGMGSFLVGGLLATDLPIVQAWMILFGTVFVTLNLAVDLTYSWIDPRIRLS
jgi:peptide/nickel transport system permease protein